MEKQKIIIFVTQILVSTVIYTFLIWIFNLIFDKDSSFDFGMLFQGFLFSIIYVPFSRWMTDRKAKAMKESD